MNKDASTAVYLITPQRLDDPVAFAEQLKAALDSGGSDCVQLRLKDVTDLIYVYRPIYYNLILTGQKKNSTDEFLVEKKDPLILPPNYEELPTPDNSPTATDEDGASSFEKTLSSNTEETDESSSSNSSEESILKQIRKK